MPIFYNKVDRLNPQNREAPKKWYLLPKSISQITEEQFYQKIANDLGMRSGQVKAVFQAAEDIAGTALCDGHTVKFGNIGTFSVSFRCWGSVSEEEATVAKIREKCINFLPGLAIAEKINKASVRSADTLKGGKKDPVEEKLGEASVDGVNNNDVDNESILLTEE